MEHIRDTHTREDQELVTLSLTHKEYFSVIMDRYSDPLRRYVRRLGIAMNEDQDDLLQDIFIKVYRNLASYRSDYAFSSWIYRIAHNETMSRFRRLGSRPEGHMVEEGDDIVAHTAHDGDELLDANTRFSAAILHEALMKLRRLHHDVIILRYFEGKEYEEISDILEIPMGSVATYLHRAKRELRLHLKGRLD
jgi:RNA polymerase sigma-70 factor, ECF subfamily